MAKQQALILNYVNLLVMLHSGTTLQPDRGSEALGRPLRGTNSRELEGTGSSDVAGAKRQGSVTACR